MIFTGLKENIKRKRLENKMTLEELANKVGVSRQTIQRYESGIISNIPSDKIESMAKALDTTPSYLMGWDEDNVDIKLVDESDEDLLIIQRERNKMSPKERTKLMNILKANFDDYNWENDDSGDIE